MRAIFISILAVFAALADGRAENSFSPPALTGQTFIHDPSTVVTDGGRYYVFGTGPGIRTKSSPNLVQWAAGKPVFREPPAWINNFVPTFGEYFWAPDIIRVDGKFLLYYAASTWQKPVSVIGLATSPTLDPAATNYLWKDCGPVIASTNGYGFNAIDPSVFRDDDGKLWLAFGSYWQGHLPDRTRPAHRPAHRNRLPDLPSGLEQIHRGRVPDAA